MFFAIFATAAYVGPIIHYSHSANAKPTETTKRGAARIGH